MTGRPTRLLAIVPLAVALCCASARAVAAPNITWEGPPSCSRDGFDRALDGHLVGTDVALAPSQRIAVHVVQKSAEHWRLALTFDIDEGPSASRSLEGRSCSEVTDAAAWVVAIAIDPSVAERMLSDDPNAEPEPEIQAPESIVSEPPEPVPETSSSDVAPEPARLEPTTTTDFDTRPSRLRVFVGAEVGPDGGALPDVGAFVRGRVGLGGAAWRVDLTGAVRTPTRRTMDQPDFVGARFDLWLVGLHAGPVLGAWSIGVGTLELPLWVGFEIGRVTARAFGFDDARTVARPFLGPTAGAALAWAPHPRVAIRLGADLLVAPWRQEFFVGGLGRVHRTGWVAARGTLGVELRFGSR